MNDYEILKNKGYVETEINPDLSDVSKIDLTEKPMGPNREDKSVTVTNREGITKKTSSIMMGYNKDGVILPDGEYVQLDELVEAINREISNDSENIVAVVKKTGKKIDTSAIKEEIIKKLKEKAEVLLNGPSEKIVNQETSTVSIKGENSSESHNKGVFMLGNKDLKLSTGEYVNKEEYEKAFDEYEFLKLGEKEQIIPPPISETPTNIVPPEEEDEIEVVEIEPAENLLKKIKKPLLIAGGLTGLSIALLPILVPGVMHANSVLWHTELVKSIPAFQDFLHVCNTILGKIARANYVGNSGEWVASNGTLINGDAAQASILAALAVHAVNTTTIGITAKKIVDAIKATRQAKREEKIEELNKLKSELNQNNQKNEGGLSR